ncbi:hypothetical protein M0R89_17165 [Halorussus limi]|uniref:Uncharacterized protein n=1 Tax=Halorussus limi TaxID=2938695 RepID=A0A8U0HT76_9EURY|nr:hypothetical protein [Halorussus limi]UPV74255.1 hypothetical protein M0R89_17165 [Halorussus limi]
MSPDWSSHLRLAVALALVASPFWLLPDAGATTYEYTAEEVEYTRYDTGYIRADGKIDGLACYDYHNLDKQCLFAAHVAQNGPVVVNQTHLLAREYEFDAEYVAVEDSGSGKYLYRWRVNRTETANEDRVTYALSAVSPPEILRNVSVPEREVSEEARRAIDGETVRTRGEPLDAAHEVVRSNGTYYHLSETENPRGGPSKWQATAAQAVAVLVGLGMLRGRWRRTR